MRRRDLSSLRRTARTVATIVLALAFSSGCSIVNDLSRFTVDSDGGVNSSMDASASGDGSVPMQDATMPCTADGECDDGVSCTTDTCTNNVCTNTPDNNFCVTAQTGDTCDPVNGCTTSSGCDPRTCVAGPCETARCENDMCVVESTCQSGQECCAGQCVPMGCDDGVSCTTDSCDDSMGCVNTPDDTACDDSNPCTTNTCDAQNDCQSANNTDSCDDGVFCNGADTCSGGQCDTHAGDPCSGNTVCDEGNSTCTGCLVDGDCPSQINSPWGNCVYEGDPACDETGTESRMVTTYSCQSGACVPNTTTQNRACSRTTENNSCGMRTCPSFGACEWSDPECDENAVQRRTCSEPRCQGGSCTPVNVPETRSCTRTTEGQSCGAGRTCPGFGNCNYSSTCDESATQSRTCTDRTCQNDRCVGDPDPETRACTRDTDRTVCGSQTCTTGNCMSDNMCGGVQTETCRTPRCTNGGCGGSNDLVTTNQQSCPFPFFEGQPCETSLGRSGCCDPAGRCLEDGPGGQCFLQ